MSFDYFIAVPSGANQGLERLFINLVSQKTRDLTALERAGSLYGNIRGSVSGRIAM